MKIPFDIKFKPQIESGEYKVQTKNGEHVEILKWEMRSINNLYPILALVSDKKIDEALRYSDKGYCGRADYSLFLVTPEPEMTTFEKRFLEIVVEIVEEKDNECPHPLEYAAELLELARKELEPEVLERLDAAYKNQDEVVYENGKRDGKAEALKDLPRWRKIEGARGNNYSQETKFSINGRYLEMNDTLNNIYEISFEELEKLSRL